MLKFSVEKLSPKSSPRTIFLSKYEYEMPSKEQLDINMLPKCCHAGGSMLKRCVLSVPTIIVHGKQHRHTRSLVMHAPPASRQCKVQHAKIFYVSKATQKYAENWSEVHVSCSKARVLLACLFSILCSCNAAAVPCRCRTGKCVLLRGEVDGCQCCKECFIEYTKTI